MNVLIEAKLASSTVGENCKLIICISIDNCFTFLSVIYNLESYKMAPIESESDN